MWSLHNTWIEVSAEGAVVGSGPWRSACGLGLQPGNILQPGRQPCNQTACATLPQPATCSEAPSLKDIACKLHQTHCARIKFQNVLRVCNAFAAAPKFFVMTVRSQALKHIAAKSFYEASGPDLPQRRRGGGVHRRILRGPEKGCPSVFRQMVGDRSEKERATQHMLPGSWPLRRAPDG